MDCIRYRDSITGKIRQARFPFDDMFWKHDLSNGVITSVMIDGQDVDFLYDDSGTDHGMYIEDFGRTSVSELSSDIKAAGLIFSWIPDTDISGPVLPV